VPLSQVRDLLGHASIVTTERYDNQQLERLQVAAGKLESGKLFEAPTGESGGSFTFLAQPARQLSQQVRQLGATTSITCCRVKRFRCGWVSGTEFATT
jgi:hypothetical protein